MKKLSAAFTALLTAAYSCGLTAFAESSEWPYLPDRGDESTLTDHGENDIAPKLTVDCLAIPYSEAAAKIVTVNIRLDGNNIDGNYCTTGFHIYWDSRLKPVAARDGNYARSGDAIEDLSFVTNNIGEYGAFVMTTGAADYGFSGVYVSFDLQIPDDAQPGDIYPIDIAYRTSDYRTDLFTNNANDEKGTRMQEYLFRHGIYSSVNPNDNTDYVEMPKYADGYIYIVPDDPTPEYTLGDVTKDGKIDARDAARVLTNYAQSSSGDISIEQSVFLASDVNLDNVVDGRDATIILTYYAKASAGKAGSFAEYLDMSR